MTTLKTMDLTLNLSLSSSSSSGSVPPPCIWDCDLLFGLGPPPDLISEMPPPPIPSFLRDPVDILVAANGSCDLCRWAGGDDVQLVEVTRKYPVVDDMWYFVVVSAVVGAILFGILVVVATLRCKEAKVKPVHDNCSKVEKVHPQQTVEPVVVPSSLGGPIMGMSHHHHHPCAMQTPKALWSALKGGETSAYALHHHPINPELLSNYERIDYGAVGHTTPPHPNSLSSSCLAGGTFRAPPPARSPPPPPPPLIPPPPLPSSFRQATYAACCPTSNNNSSAAAVADNIEGGVRIMGNGNASYYANPESLDGSFENGGYVDSECSLEVLKVAPDGAVVGRRGRPCFTPVRGGCGGNGGWEEAILRQRIESIPSSGPDRTPPPHPPPLGGRYVLPPVSRLVTGPIARVSTSPLV